MTQLLSDGVLLTKEDKSGKSYLRLRVLERGEFSLVDIETNAEFVLQKSHLESLVEEGRFSVADQAELDAIQKELDNLPPIELKQSLDEKKRRLKYVEGALKADIPLGSPQRFKSYISIKSIELRDRKPPSAVTLYRWVKKYVDSNGDAASLMPGYRKAGNRTPKVPSEHDQFINTVIASLVGNPKTSVVYDTYLDKLAEHNEQRARTGLERISPVTQESIRKRLKRRITL
ncbi:hypothetical protein F9817_17090 [Vibrio sp. CAIM 722]|uniref:Uncharacterized protein n=1 Tax=Vibrio eleionomae TaxID=2653505 RepID=A0A7X4LMZ6_9VIBR|nr:hypothetical protein [Vibrio eleionomae]MZI94894.1 hypothetical protein [Vibrio eleionomae]